MQPAHMLVIAATILTLSSTSAFSDTTIEFDPFLMRECPQADGSAPLHQQGFAGLQTDDTERTVGRAPRWITCQPITPPWPRLLTTIFLRTLTAIRPV